jgi:diaminopimelate epimerase
MRIAKAQGLGNDFLLQEGGGASSDISAWTRRVCDRHVGIGADGLILYTVRPGGDGATMRLFNADGGEAEISGNGLRCLSGFLVSRGRLAPAHTVETGAGPRSVRVASAGGVRYRITADLGTPILASRDIPIALETPRSPVVDLAVPLEGAGSVSVTCTSMGNPHCALFLPQVADDALVAALGAKLERHPLFPRRTNVEFITVTSPRELRVRFWERGVGATRSSGTGAASAVVAAVVSGRADRLARVTCDGGVLEVDWPEGGTVRQTGEVEVLFEADWLAG